MAESTFLYLTEERDIIPHRSPQPRVKSITIFVRVREQRDSSDDPSAGSPTETLLRLLLPLVTQVGTSLQSCSMENHQATMLQRAHLCYHR